MRAMQGFPEVEVEPVPNDIHEDDRLIVQRANESNQTIVTRDGGFPARRLCSINGGVVFIPQKTSSGSTVRLEEVLPCLTRLLESGRLRSLGHGVCTVFPTEIALRLPSGEETYPLNQI